MALITLLNAQLAFGHVPLLDHTDFALESNERVGLIGRNGAGKSSMLKILGGMEKIDDGQLQFQQNLRIAYVAQEPLLDPQATVFEAVSAGVAAVIGWIDQYSLGEGDLDALQDAIEAQDGWNWEQRVEETLHRLHLDRDSLIGSLSGGTKKRVALGQALVSRPEVLLLDEPTNHLDLALRHALLVAIQAFEGAVVMVSHDRNMVSVICDELWLVSGGQVKRFDGDLDDYAKWLRQWRAEQARVAVTASAAARAAAPAVVAATPAATAVAAPVSVSVPAPAKKVVRSADVRALQQSLSKTEAAVAKGQQRLTELAALLADSALYGSDQQARLQQLLDEQKQVQATLDADEAKWLALGEELDELTG